MPSARSIASAALFAGSSLRIAPAAALACGKVRPFSLAIAVYFLVTLPLGILRPFWYDELSARWVSEAASFAEFAARVRTGLEPSPPLYLFLQYLSVHTFGPSEWTSRLPSMLGYAVSLIFLFLFVARRLGPLGGSTAMAVLILSGSIYYAQEGRPYGLVFGCASLAMWSWQQYTERRLSRYALLCGIALFTAPSLHYYAVLLAVPFALAELVRTWQSRRLDWKMIVVCAVPAVALLVHLPLIRTIMPTLTNPAFGWSRPTFAFPAVFWLRALQPGLLVFIGVIVLLLYFQHFRSSEDEPARYPLPASELALLIGFALIPVVGLVFSKLVTNAIVPRYVFTAMLGFAAISAHVLARISTVGLPWIYLLLLTAAAGNGLLDLRWQLRYDSRPGQLEIPSASGIPSLPVVMDDYIRFANLGRYAPPEILSRLVYLVDLERSTRYTTGGQMEMMTFLGVKQGQFPGHAEHLAHFLQRNARFLLFEPIRPNPGESWLSHDLLDRGLHLRLIGIKSGGRWYLVQRK